MLSIDDVINATDAKTVKVPCPEWGGDVYLTTMPSDEYDKFDRLFSYLKELPAEKVKGMRAEFVSRCWSDESGNRIEVTPKQLAGLKGKSPVPIGRLFKEAVELHSDVRESEGN